MEARIVCNNCAKFEFNDDLSDDLIDADSIFNNNLCPKCTLVIKSHFNGQLKTDSNSKDSGFVKLPKKSIYFHVSDNLLNIVQQSDTSKEANAKCKYGTKNVLLIGCGGIKRMNVLQNLLKFKFNRLVYLCSEKKWAFDFFDDLIYAEHENINEKEATLGKVKEYMKLNNIKFDAIFTYDDLSIMMASYLANYFNLPAIPFEVCRRTRNKYELRKLSTELGISAPKYFMIKSADRKSFIEKIKNSKLCDLQSEYRELMSFPLICKNPTGVSKDFVEKCNSIEDVYNCIEESIQIWDEMDVLVEEYYDGHELDIEILIQSNEIKFISIWDNLPALEPYCFEQGGACPSFLLSKTEENAIANIITKWVKRMNFQNACLHFEARCRPQFLYKDRPIFASNEKVIDENYFLMPIEINQRLGGAETWSVIKTVYDICLFEEHLNISLGLKLNEKLLEHKRTHPRFRCISKDIHPARNVKLNSIQVNIKKLQRNPNAVEISIFRSPDEKLGIKDYVGWVTAKNELNCSYEEIKETLNDILECVRFEFIYILNK